MDKEETIQTKSAPNSGFPYPHAQLIHVGPGHRQQLNGLWGEIAGDGVLGIAANAPGGWKAGTGRDSEPQNLSKQNEEGPVFETRKTKQHSNKKERNSKTGN